MHKAKVKNKSMDFERMLVMWECPAVDQGNRDHETVIYSTGRKTIMFGFNFPAGVET